MQGIDRMIWQDLPLVFPGGPMPAVVVRYTTKDEDELARPTLRILRGAAQPECVLLAASPGTVEWTGLLPRNATGLQIGFAADATVTHATASPASGLALLLRASWRAPRAALAAMFCHFAGWHTDAQINFQRAQSPTPREVLQRLARYIDDTFAPTAAARDDAGLTTLVVVHCAGASSDAVSQSWRALLAQTTTNWRAVALGADTTLFAGDTRVTFDPPKLGPILADATYLAVIEAGDRPAPYFIAALGDRLQRDLNTSLVYCDEWISRVGSVGPHLKPAWSPTIETQRPYVGHAALVRTASVLDADEVVRSGTDDLIQKLLFALPPKTIARFAKPLFHRTENKAAKRNPLPPALAAPATMLVSLVIPVRDRPELLDALLTSLRRNPQTVPTEIVIVDNGSRTPTMRHLLSTSAARDDAIVIDADSPFNFSALCNAGAKVARGHALLFLNNDIVMTTSDTVARLLAHATQPDVGAVGAKLLYPDGRVQHAGIALGLFGTCGHFGAKAQADDEGWCGTSAVAHEVSAVTGACLMVLRDRFEAVSGFDERLAVEFGDIDLCLRLGERGWRTICDASTSLVHKESASRGGATFRRQTVHAGDRALFLERWGDRLASDPYHHPAWPLYDAASPPY